MEWITAIASLVGMFLGTGVGILVSARLTNYRIQQLENKVDKHNKLCERMIAVEKDVQYLKHELLDDFDNE